MARINGALHRDAISGVCMGVREGHLIKKLRDKRGVWLCSNYPDYVAKSNEDMNSEVYGILLYLVEKVPSGSQDDEEELEHYAKMQDVMELLLQQLKEPEWKCLDLVPVGALNVEWEHDIFGGWNGMSVSVKMEEYEI